MSSCTAFSNEIENIRNLTTSALLQNVLFQKYLVVHHLS